MGHQGDMRMATIFEAVRVFHLAAYLVSSFVCASQSGLEHVSVSLAAQEIERAHTSPPKKTHTHTRI